MRLIDCIQGDGAMISPEAHVYGDYNIHVGDGSRIDHGCILIGDIDIGEHTHIPPYCILYGKYGIKIGNYVNLGVYTSLHTESESFTGEFLMGPLVPEHTRKPDRRPIEIKDYATICTRCTILPGVTIGEGAIVGAHSMVRENVTSGAKVVGTPARRIGWVSRKMMELA